MQGSPARLAIVTAAPHATDAVSWLKKTHDPHNPSHDMSLLSVFQWQSKSLLRNLLHYSSQCWPGGGGGGVGGGGGSKFCVFPM